jgi:phosphatidylserine/phosphatidylglycerophosphate/cardiolipin synthase-like enzyme
VDFALALSSCKLELISGRTHYERVIAAVREAEHSVWIATANLKELMVEDWRVRPGRRRNGRPEYRSVLEVFSELADRKVELRILHASLPSRAFREAFDREKKLVRGGMELRMCPRVHLKTVIVDGRFLYLGSANWTGAGLGAKGEHRRNFELGMITEDEAVLDQVQALYASIWEGAACAKCALRDVCEAPLSL